MNEISFFGSDIVIHPDRQLNMNSMENDIALIILPRNPSYTGKATGIDSLN